MCGGKCTIDSKKKKKVDGDNCVIREETGLASRFPNTKSFKTELEKVFRQNDYREVSVLAFEIVNIYKIDRYLGEEYGNYVRNIFENMAKEVFNDYQIYSIYYNEFSIIVPNLEIDKIKTLGEIFIEKFGKPILLNKMPIKIDVSCGIVTYPHHGKSAEEIFKKMGSALEQCKTDAKNIVFYDSKIDEEIKNDYKILRYIHDAIENKELEIKYHPKICISQNKVVGAEALLRCDKYRNISICEFIRISENVGYITDISKIVINLVIDQMEKWQRQGIEMIISINISPLDLLNDNLYEYLKERLSKSTVNPELLELEITERCIYKDEKKVSDLMWRLKNLGIRMAMDDFGIGYNSLKNIFEFPFDTIKIDKYFIDSVEKNTGEFVKGIINCAKIAGKGVIAEGVETREQVEILLDMGCDVIQGFYFSKPLNSSCFLKYLSEFNN